MSLRATKTVSLAAFCLPPLSLAAGLLLPFPANAALGAVGLALGCLLGLIALVLALRAGGGYLPSIGALLLTLVAVVAGPAAWLVATPEGKALAAGLAPARPAAGSAAASAGPLIDEEYRFRIDPPGPGWLLLDRAEVRRSAPAAVAGARKGAEGFAVVIVEQVPDVPLDTYARLIVDNLALEDKEETAFEDVRFKDLDAKRFEVTGRVSGISMRYEGLVVIRGGWAYQLLGWGLPEKVGAGGKWLQPFRDAFALLPGEVVPEASAAVATADSAGVGWRLKDGVFESAVLDLAVAPPEGFRVAVGAELTRINASAEVGLVSTSPEMYLVIIGERESPELRAAQAVAAEERFVAGSGLQRAGPALASRFGSEPLALRRYRSTSGLPFHYLYGARSHRGHLLQVLAWSMAGLAGAMEREVPRALESVRLLSDAEASRLREQLEAARVHPAQIEGSSSLREGVFRDFDAGLVWRPPARGFFRIEVGQQAREAHPDALAWLQEPSSGLSALLTVEPLESRTARELFDDACLLVLGVEATPAPARFGDAEGLVSGPMLSDDGFQHQLATVLWRDEGYRLHLWGYPDHLAAAPELAPAVFEGLRFSEDALKATRSVGSRYEDRRFGFAFDPGAGWQMQELAPEVLRAKGTLVQWRRGTRETILIFAVQASEPGQDETWFTDLFLAQARSSFHLGRLDPAAARESRLGSLPARLQSFRRLGTGVDCVIASRSGVHFGLLALGRGLLAAPPTDAARTAFSLLE